MSHFRQNFITKEWVIIAPERAKRPDQFRSDKGLKVLPEYDATCPFCPGNEHLTPPAVMEIKSGGSWAQRTVPNKFAAVMPELSAERHLEGKYLTVDGFGIAEVVVEHPSHNKDLALLELEDVKGVLRMYKERATELAKNPQVDLVTIFKNHGLRAGTSLEHSHSQIIATAIVPIHMRYWMNQALTYHDDFGECPFCLLLKDELRYQVRVIIDSEHFVAWCPFASKSPFEIRVMPKRHNSQYDCINEAEIDDLAVVLRSLLKKLYNGLADPDYNFVIYSSTVSEGETQYFHWQMTIVPKLTTPAGFEMGTGIFINVMPPEDAAKFLREVSVA